MRKKLLFIFLCISLHITNLWGQTTYSIGPNAPYSGYAGNFTSITNAIATLGTITTPVVLEFQSDYVSTVETYPISVTNIVGASATNTVTFRPKSGISAITFTSGAASATLSMNGTNYVTFDGRDGGAGTNKNLIFLNQNTSGQAIRFLNNATNNVITYCEVRGRNTSTAVIDFLASAGTGNDDNTISFCEITSDGTNLPNTLITSSGLTSINDRVRILNCNLSNFFSPTADHYGIFVNSQASDWTIQNNKFFQSGTRDVTGTGVDVVVIRTVVGTGYLVDNNTIGYTNVSSMGAAWTMTGNSNYTFTAISLGGGGTVSNNTITAITQSSTSANAWRGIIASSGNVSITGNTIGSLLTNDVINVTAGAGADGLIAINNATIGTVSISNNNIGGLKVTSTLATATRIKGILNAGSGTVTISSNTIGGTLPHSLVANITITTTGSPGGSSNAIESTAGTTTISNNTIRNFTAYTTNGAGAARGILASGGTHSVAGNTVFNLTINSTNGGTGSGASIIGISTTSGGASNNIIYNLVNTSTGAGAYGVVGLFANTSTATIDRNTIYNLAVKTIGTGFLSGLAVVGGTFTFANNIVRLGFDETGSAITTGYDIRGIDEAGGTNNFYHNSVFIGGTGVTTGTTSTAAFRTSVTLNTRNYQNNIFINNRSNGTGTGSHASIWLTGTPSAGVISGLTNNYNIYQANGTGGTIVRHPSASPTNYTLKAWREFTLGNYDLNSGVGSPNFIDAVGVTPDLRVQSNTSAEATGLNISAVTNDREDETRATLTPTDIGADAGNYTLTNTEDIFTPNISFVALQNTSSLANRILTATLTDVGSGIDNTTFIPRIYFRKNSGGWQTTQGSLMTGTLFNGTWNFTINNSLMGGVVVNDIVDYYVVAQDITGNVWATKFVGFVHPDVNTNTTAPTTPDNYRILAPISGNYDVCATCTYTSLTQNNAQGFFKFVNDNILTGNTTVTIKSNLIEDGAVALNQFLVEPLLSNFTILIQGDGGTYTINNNSVNLTVPLIKFNGADRVTVDGGIGKNLTFENSHTTPGSALPTFQYDNTAIDCALKNINIRNNTTGSTQGIVTIITTTTNASSVEINGCRLYDITNQPTNAIFVNSANSVLLLRNSQVYNFTTKGVNLNSYGSACEISGNSFYNTSTVTTEQFIIDFGSSTQGGHTITGNYIGGTAPLCGGTNLINSSTVTTSFVGIDYDGASNNPSSIQGNIIKKIDLTSTANTALRFRGININTGSANIGTITRNEVSDISSVGRGDMRGISISSTSSTDIVNVENSLIEDLSGIMTTPNTNGAVHGIYTVGSGTRSFINNEIKNLVGTNSTTGSDAPAVGGIVTGASVTNYTISRNTISNLNLAGGNTPSGVVAGIVLQGSSTGTDFIVSRNRIFDLRNTYTGATARIVGIIQRSAIWTFTHNQVTLTNTGNTTNNPQIYGITDDASASVSVAQKVYYNTVYIGGTTTTGTATNHSFAYRRSTNNLCDVRNNVFINDRNTSIVGNKTYAIGSQAATNANLQANYNLLIDITPTILALDNTIDRDFATWKTTNSQDPNSWNATTGATSDYQTLNASNLFVDLANGNLNINTANAEAWFVNGKGTQITGFADDFGATSVRSVTLVGGATDLGSDEMTPTSEPINANATPTAPTVGIQTFTFAGRQVASINWVSGTLPASVSVSKYYSGTNPSPNQNGVGMPGARYLNAYWKFEVTGGSGFVYDITLNYDDAMLGLVQPAQEAANEIRLSKKDVGNNYWTTYTTINGGSTNNSAANTITKTGLTSFSEFTGSTESQPLPITLLSFTGNRQNDNDVLLKWTTATEINNKGFEIEQSTNAQDFQKINFVDGAGNSTTIKNYELIVNNLSDAYYRLKQIDFDGSFSYSNIIFIKGNDNIINVYPNPTTEKININTSKLRFNYKLVSSQGVNVLEGDSANKNVTIDVSTLAKGLYLLHIIQDGKMTIKKIIVQ
ncbi:MAG: T9SS C-terminal target domain-containing protein [Bacteroidetes bacterium]|nr:MAG: T9SS C-terminal target domain-containing protein [Bacteroidota bacterium]TAG90381.1 MAG: T9SS C-terminal target domain-containing protein [Bacteroidota bacterium]